MVDVVTEHGAVFLGSRLKRLAERLQADAAQVTAAAGVPLQPGHMGIMTALDRSDRTIGGLVDDTGSSQPGVTRTVGQLEALGMITRKAGHDQRERLVSLTAQGKAAIELTKAQVWPKLGHAVQPMLDSIGAMPFLDQIAALEAALAEEPLVQRAARVQVPGFVFREFSDELAPAFHDINAEWITAMFALEETDRKVLENPRREIIDRGGAILFVEVPGKGIVGTCALQQTSPGKFELTKMGVSEAARGLKAGEALLAAMIERAREMGAQQLYLLTNRKCAAAIHLYEKAGFRHDAGIMRDYGSRYQRCDVAMDYPL
ncbi:MAG: GNAT family N-acetyltransferase [Novosphingobium sp.]